MPYKNKEDKKKWYERNRERMKIKKKKYYQENKERFSKKYKEYREKNKDYIKKWKREHHQKKKHNFLLKYKIGKSCVLCGYNEYPEILHFHHKDRKDKSFVISKFKNTLSKQELLKKEINKCILLCPNCHSWLHYSEGK